jgi:hypothetical protein
MAKSTDKCRSGRHRKVIRWTKSLRDSWKVIGTSAVGARPLLRL